MKIVSVPILALGLLLWNFSGGSAQAQIITLDFDSSLTLPTDQSFGAGAAATTGWYNNSQNATSGAGLLDNSDTATTTSWAFNVNTAQNGNEAAYNATYDRNSPLPSGAAAIFNGVAYGANANNVTLELSLSNIPYTAYSIYVYSDSQGEPEAIQDFTGGVQQGSTYYVNSGQSGASTSYLLGTSTTSGSPTDPANYVVFTGLTGGSQYIDLTTQNNFFGIIDGVEIVNTAAAPEPSTEAMMLAGLGLLMALQKWRRLC